MAKLTLIFGILVIALIGLSALTVYLVVNYSPLWLGLYFLPMMIGIVMIIYRSIKFHISKK